MIDLIDEILEGELSEAKLTLEDRIEELFYEKLEQLRSEKVKK